MSHRNLNLKVAMIYSFAGTVSLSTTTLLLQFLVYEKGEHLGLGWFLSLRSPYMWWTVGIVLAVMLSFLGSSIAVHSTRNIPPGRAVRGPRLKIKDVIAILFEAAAIYGLITAILMSGALDSLHVKEPSSSPADMVDKNYLSGFTMFGSGLAVGIINMVCGIAVGIKRTSIKEFASPLTFIKILIVEFIATGIGLIGLLFGIYMTAKGRVEYKF